MKIEVISYRDHDGWPQTVAFIDGKPVSESGVDWEQVELDDGAGWLLEEWREHVRESAEGLTPAAAEVVRAAGETMERSPHIREGWSE